MSEDVTKIGVCTTLAAYVMEPRETWASWIENQTAVSAEAEKAGVATHYFAALELDGRGINPLIPVVRALDLVSGDHWTYTLDDGRTEITTANRLRHLTMGQNLASEWCTSMGMDYMLFLAADTQAPDDIIPRMLEMEHPLCGPELPTYCLRGPVVEKYTEFPVQEHMISAACIFIAREVFKILRWRADGEMGMTDDPAYQFDASTLLNIPSYVRKDVFARHFPECIPAVEKRFTDQRDLKVY